MLKAESGNVRVKWDNSGLVTVSVEREYHNENLRGLCGNADGNAQNEFKNTNAAAFGNKFKGEKVINSIMCRKMGELLLLLFSVPM